MAKRRLRYLREVYGAARGLLGAALSGVELALGQYLPPKPTVLQFPVNDICNSHCVMCDIWPNKKGLECSPAQFGQVLSNELFREIRVAGINGGEPTLRKDLVEIGEVLVAHLPRLRSVNLITNGIQEGVITERVPRLARVFRERAIRFDVCVSLDGLESDHDRNRGVAGNFRSAERVIDALRGMALNVSIGCTLTPLNCFGADDLWLWCRQKGIAHCEFRLGVEIERLYNHGFEGRHPFSAEQVFHLQFFFDRLAQDPREPLPSRRFYRSLSDQLAYGRPRQAGCDWKLRGVTLDSRGNISFCSVRSPILGSALERGAWEIFKEGLPVRRQILRDHCSSCRHDLSGPPTLATAWGEARQVVARPWRRFPRKIRNWRGFPLRHLRIRFREAARPLPCAWRSVVITGWYGTETAGDKAILGEILAFLKQASPDCRIALTTLDSRVSRQTNREVPGLERVTLLPLEDAACAPEFHEADAVIMGGGPFEEIDETRRIFDLFRKASQAGKARVVFGCGIAPLPSRYMRALVREILASSTGGFLRDHESAERLVGLGVPKAWEVACDPALAYLARTVAPARAGLAPGSDPLRLVTLLRANTWEYIPGLEASALEGKNEELAVSVAEALQGVSERWPMRIRLLPMHCLPTGGDDRIFNRAVLRHRGAAGDIQTENAYVPLQRLLEELGGADLAVAMRYHGHLFCLGLGIPFVSVDYTGQEGKVESLVRRIRHQQHALKWGAFTAAELAGRIADLVPQRVEASKRLCEERDKLLDTLYGVYRSHFQVPHAPGTALRVAASAAAAEGEG